MSLLSKRLAKLEGAQVTHRDIIVCTPLPAALQAHSKEIAPGVYTSRYHQGGTARSVWYTSTDLLNEWLALPEQSASQVHTYVILSNEQCEAIKAELNSQC